MVFGRWQNVSRLCVTARPCDDCQPTPQMHPARSIDRIMHCCFLDRLCTIERDRL